MKWKILGALLMFIGVVIACVVRKPIISSIGVIAGIIGLWLVIKKDLKS